MLFDIAESLVFIPLESHILIVTTNCGYVKLLQESFRELATILNIWLDF